MCVYISGISKERVLVSLSYVLETRCSVFFMSYVLGNCGFFFFFFFVNGKTACWRIAPVDYGPYGYWGFMYFYFCMGVR
jgi:hypothetical protein